MKSKALRLWIALIMVGVITGCSENESPTSEQNQTQMKNVTIRATIDGDLRSRVVLEEDEVNQVVKVSWAQGDNFKIKVNGIDYTFSYMGNDMFECSKANFPATFENTGTITATYPAAASTAYANQPGTLKGAASLLAMKATLEVVAGQSTENLALKFKHENSIMKLTLNHDDFKGLPVTWVTLKSGSTVVASASESFAGTASNGELKVYFVVNPQEMTDVSIHSVCMKKDYSATLEDQTLTAGKFYDISKAMTFAAPMGNVSAAEAVLGDYAMADGTFISGDATLTDEEKANVAGIVFWTAKQPTDAKLTPAKLTDDAVMAKDFPTCTHGLIVSLKNVSDSTKWQEKRTRIADWQNSVAFDDEDKGIYKSIASTSGTDNPQSELINYILGYQNTKLLKAYNASLPSGSANTVLPVSLLEAFSVENPAPAKTTGWFIPSGKEFALLRGKDVDNVARNKSGGSDTKIAINERLASLGPDWADMMDDIFLAYWGSSEDDNIPTSSNAVSGIFDADHRGVTLFMGLKDANFEHVRAVCAY